jgi:two-component system nitrogen regulation sensor histidine kinase NtrY
MKLRTKYLLFVIIVHLVTVVLSFMIFRDNKLLFLCSEVLILISIFMSWRLYQELLQPLQTLLRGSEAIRDREFNMKFVTTGTYELDQLIGVYNQMMEHLQLERTKQEEQHLFLSKLIDTSPTGIVVLDHDGRIQRLNPKALFLLGMDEANLRAQNPADIDHAVLQEINKLGSGASRTLTINGASTYKIQKSHFIDRGFPRHFIMIEELTNEILAAEKKAYGKVIRMMAHEVNNTIGPVNSIIQSSLNSPEIWRGQNAGPFREALEVALDRNQNLNLFMRNFADVVRIPPPNKKDIDLNTLVHRVATLMRTKATEQNISFECVLAEGRIPLLADEQQMEQVLINILKNAIEAVGENGAVRLTTKAYPKLLVISDSGKGIDEQHTEHLFTPFYSTKRNGQGIGLTLVKDILSNHGFIFSLKTVAPGNTEFEIRFN